MLFSLCSSGKRYSRPMYLKYTVAKVEYTDIVCPHLYIKWILNYLNLKVKKKNIIYVSDLKE